MPWISSSRRESLPADWPRIRALVLNRDHHECQIGGPGCLVDASDVDHVKRGSDHSLSNLRAACKRCHARKSSSEGNNRKRELAARRKRPVERHPGGF